MCICGLKYILAIIAGVILFAIWAHFDEDLK